MISKDIDKIRGAMDQRQKDAEQRIHLSKKSMFKDLGLDTENKKGETALDKERKQASFDVKLMTNWWDGGSQEQTARKKFFELQIPDELQANPIYVRSDVPREATIAESNLFFVDIHAKHTRKGFKLKQGDISHMNANRTMSGSARLNLDLFINMIRAQGTNEQIEFWVPKAIKYEINGAYSQTELGHGSNVRAILTRADYDVKSKEFILNTPVLEACKWWNTGLVSATHTVLAAQLYCNGVHKGLHYFMLQLRDENLEPMPGVFVFDIGPKMGENQCDIGGMLLKDVRIPKDNLLSKQAFVDDNGNYTPRRSKSSNSSGSDKSAKLKFIPMMQTRTGMVLYASTALAQAATIAARYSCVRHQGYVNSDKEGPGLPENPVMNYEIQSYRVLKAVAGAYALRSVGAHMREKIGVITRGTDVEEALRVLPETHATISGLKALSTVMAADGIEDLRRACGGHGYIMSSGIAALEADYKGINVTGEGEVTVLMLQTARYLMKSYQSAIKGEPLAPLTSCLAPLKDPGFDPIKQVSQYQSTENFRDLKFLVSLFQYRVLVYVSRVGKEFANLVNNPTNPSKNVSFDDAMRLLARKLHDASTSHCQFFLLSSFVGEIEKVKDASVQNILSKLGTLYGLSAIQEGRGCSWAGLLTIDQMEAVNTEISKLLRELRPDVIPLVDAFDYPDAVLNSAIGSKDGLVYERLFEAAVKSSLNTNPDGSRITVPTFVQVLKPYVDVEFLKSNPYRSNQKASPSSSPLPIRSSL